MLRSTVPLRALCLAAAVAALPLLLTACAGTVPPAPIPGPVALDYSGDVPEARAELLDALARNGHVVARDDSSLGLVRTALRPLTDEEQAGPPSGQQAQLWFRLIGQPDGSTRLSARALLAVSVSTDSLADEGMTLKRDLFPTHPFAAPVFRALITSGFEPVPQQQSGPSLGDLSREVYDDQL